MGGSITRCCCSVMRASSSSMRCCLIDRYFFCSTAYSACAHAKLPRLNTLFERRRLNFHEVTAAEIATYDAEQSTRRHPQGHVGRRQLDTCSFWKSELADVPGSTANSASCSAGALPLAAASSTALASLLPVLPRFFGGCSSAGSC